MELHVCNLNLRRVVPSLTFIMPLAEITGVPAFFNEQISYVNQEAATYFHRQDLLFLMQNSFTTFCSFALIVAEFYIFFWFSKLLS